MVAARTNSAWEVSSMSTSPGSMMMLEVLHFSGACRVQRRAISLPRVDALLNDPDTRYSVTTEEHETKPPPVSLRPSARHSRPRHETNERGEREMMSESKHRELALQRLATLWTARVARNGC